MRLPGIWRHEQEYRGSKRFSPTWYRPPAPWLLKQVYLLFENHPEKPTPPSSQGASGSFVTTGVSMALERSCMQPAEFLTQVLYFKTRPEARSGVQGVKSRAPGAPSGMTPKSTSSLKPHSISGSFSPTTFCIQNWTHHVTAHPPPQRTHFFPSKYKVY